jgi:hypothetical protein
VILLGLFLLLLLKLWVALFSVSFAICILVVENCKIEFNWLGVT